MLFLKSKFAYLRQTLLYLYSFVYNTTDDDFVQAETCRMDIINDKWLCIDDYAILCTK